MSSQPLCTIIHVAGVHKENNNASLSVASNIFIFQFLSFVVLEMADCSTAYVGQYVKACEAAYFEMLRELGEACAGEFQTSPVSSSAEPLSFLNHFILHKVPLIKTFLSNVECYLKSVSNQENKSEPAIKNLKSSVDVEAFAESTLPPLSVVLDNILNLRMNAS